MIKLISLKASPKKKIAKKHNFINALAQIPVYKSPRRLFQEYSSKGELKFVFEIFRKLFFFNNFQDS